MSPLLAAVLLVAVAAGLVALGGALAYGGGTRTVLLWPSPDEDKDGDD